VLALTLEEIAHTVGGLLHDVPDPEVRVTGPVVIDSREVDAGGLFTAYLGEHVDGHDFAAAAIEAGAVAVLGNRPVGVPAIVVEDVVEALGVLARSVVGRLDGITLIGLTGSSGKTTTKDLIAQVLDGFGRTVATARSFNNEIGLPLTALRVDERTRFLVLEMGARGRGHLSYLTRLTPPRVGLVLNVGAAHAGEFGSREATAQAKGELIEALPSAADGGVAVLNVDDELVAGMAGRTDAEVVWFGRAARAEITAADVRLNDAGQARFHLKTPGGSAPVALQLYGEHQVSNSLAAAAVAHSLGMSAEAIAEALTRARPISRARMEVTRRDDGVTVVNDAFNANPDSVRAALTTLTAMTARRRFAVLGEMAELGEDALNAHEEVGRLAGRLNVTRLIAIGGEHAAAILAGAVAEQPGLDAELVPDKNAAEQLLRRELRAGDVVLVKASKSAGLQTLGARLAEPLPAADQSAT
jgi:UDP-N-acetylmuramoyl-tripeptide--D-alanyl-D-alanine ligase